MMKLNWSRGQPGPAFHAIAAMGIAAVAGLICGSPAAVREAAPFKVLLASSRQGGDEIEYRWLSRTVKMMHWTPGKRITFRD